MIALVVVLVTAAIVVLFLIPDKQNDHQTSWYVEMWNIRHGYALQMQFASNIIIGRNSAYYWGTGAVPQEADITVSAEHCMLYEEDGLLLICNMSAVNPAVLNGHRINMPVALNAGDRLEMGRSVFLITRVVAMEQ